MRIGRGHSAPGTSNHSLYLIKLIFERSYPEGNFGWNQLLDGSISLSPLNTNLTMDLHVTIATDLHQSFPWLHPIHAKFTIFRVLKITLTLRPKDRSQMAGGWCPCGPTTVTFIAHGGLPPLYSRHCETPWSVFLDGVKKTISSTSRAIARLSSVRTGSEKALEKQPTVSPHSNRC